MKSDCHVGGCPEGGALDNSAGIERPQNAQDRERRLRVAHVTTSLRVGGAETMLQSLLKAQTARPIDNYVFCLTGGGALAEPIRQLGVEVLEAPSGSVMGMGWLAAMMGVGRVGATLAQMLRRAQFDVVQTWMYHADLVGSVAGAIAGIPVVWGVHATTLTEERLATRALVRSLVPLSRLVPARIISCSESALRAHVDRGYDASRSCVVPNGFDTIAYHPDPEARARLHAELGEPSDAPLVGLCARFHPLKGHLAFLQAAAQVIRSVPSVRFVLCGSGVTLDNPVLREATVAAGLTRHCHFLGLRRDMARIYPGLDVLVSASAGEAFPLVLGEAMACATPCVATDVGDSALMIADTGFVVPPRNPPALAAAIVKMVQLPEESRRELGVRARALVKSKYGIDVVARRYEEIHREVARRATPNRFRSAEH